MVTTFVSFVPTGFANHTRLFLSDVKGSTERLSLIGIDGAFDSSPAKTFLDFFLDQIKFLSDHKDKNRINQPITHQNSTFVSSKVTNV